MKIAGILFLCALACGCRKPPPAVESHPIDRPITGDSLDMKAPDGFWGKSAWTKVNDSMWWYGDSKYVCGSILFLPATKHWAGASNTYGIALQFKNQEKAMEWVQRKCPD
jgi:hypothetical protein